MIYLSQLILDPTSRQVQKEFVSPYQMHRTLSHAFPGLAKPDFEKARILFRVDADKNHFQLLVQSKIEPDWVAFAEHLEGKRYLSEAPKVTSLDFGNLRCEPGTRFRFRLLANPTYRPFVAKEAKTSKNIDRHGLFREYERLDWLLHRSRKEHGFDFDTYELEVRPIIDHDGKTKPVIFRGKAHDEPLKLEVPAVEVTDLNDGRRFSWRKDGKPDKDDQLSAARFDGVLTVTDREKFLAAVENGVGPAKGFGFGLLSLARI